MTERTSQTDPDQKRILQLYAAFGTGLVLSALPYAAAAGLSLVFLLGVLIAAYRMRGKAEKGSLTENHTTFIIRTLWIGSFFAVITLGAASIYMVQALDNTPLDPCIQQFLSAAPDPASIELQALTGIFQGCFDEFWTANFQVLVISGLIGILPVVFYFVVRFFRGLGRALKHYRVDNAHGWF